jgi:hypothetical protein
MVLKLTIMSRCSMKEVAKVTDQIADILNTDG